MKFKEKSKAITKFLGTSLMCCALGLGIFSVVSPTNVEATREETTTITYYPVYDYVEHTNLMDATTNVGEHNVFSNANGLAYSVNIGYHGGLNGMAVTMTNILGGGYTFDNGYKDMVFDSWQKNGYLLNDASNQDSGFSLEDSGGMEVQEVRLVMYAVKKDETYASFNVYKNGAYNNSGDSSINNGNYYSCNAYYDGTKSTTSQDDDHQCNNSDLIGTFTPTAENPTVTLNEDQLNNGASSFMGTDGILIVFNDEDNISKIYFKSFQVTKYKVWEIVRWSTEADYVQKSDTERLYKGEKITKSYKTVVGDFSPNYSVNDVNDTSAKWVTSISTSFNASTEGLFDYPDTLISHINFTDFGRDGANTKNRTTGSSPSEMSSGGVGYINFIENSLYGGVNILNATWTGVQSGNGYHWTVSVPYSDSTGTYKKTASLDSVYWDNAKNEENNKGWISYDESWCKHNNADHATCYKHSGYHSHGTVWDGSVYLFKTVDDKDRVIANSKYTYTTYDGELANGLKGTTTIVKNREVNDGVVEITDASGNQLNSAIVTGDNIASTLSTTNEGVYKFNVTLTDAIDNEITVSSELFYIDLTKPTITFKDSDSEKWYTDGESFPAVTVNVVDKLSGVNEVKVVREWSTDGNAWESDGVIETVLAKRVSDKTVDLNRSQSDDVSVRLNVVDGCMYYRFKVIAEDIAGNQSEAMSPVYKYDASPNANYSLSTPRLRTDTSSCLASQDECLNWTNQDVIVTTTFADEESGISKGEILKGTVYNSNTEGKFYQINYDLDGGTMNSSIMFYTTKMSVTLPTPIKEGYTFLGWTGSNGSTPQKSVTIASGSGDTKSYKANWQAGDGEDEIIKPGNIRVNDTSVTNLINFDNSVIKVLGEYNNQKVSNITGLTTAADNIVNGESYTQTTRVVQNDGLYLAAKDKNGNVSYTPYIVDHIDKEAPKVTFGTVDTNTWNTEKKLKDVIVYLDDGSLSGIKTATVTRQKCKATSVEVCNNENKWESMGTNYEENVVVWSNGNGGTTYSSSIQEVEQVNATVGMEALDGYLYYRVSVTTKDFAGNETVANSPVQKYDAIPTISYTHTPTEYKGGQINWTNQDVYVTVNVGDDESGVESVCIAKGGNTWKDCETIIESYDGQLGENRQEVTGFYEDERIIEGEQYYLVVIDKNHHENSTPYHTIHIDKINPDASFDPYDKPEKNSTSVTVTVKVYDSPDDKDDHAMSDVDKWTIETSNNDGKSWTEQGTYSGDTTKEQKVTFTETGYHKIKVTITDKAGNTNERTSGTYIVLGNPPTIIAKTYYWWQGDDVNVYDDLKAQSNAISELDGDLSDKVIISRITYADGEIVDYPKDKIKTTSEQTFVAEFEVEDSNGNKAYTSQTYHIIGKISPYISEDNTADYYVYQRYIDERKIALDNNSNWQTKVGFKNVLDEAVNSEDPCPKNPDGSYREDASPSCKTATVSRD